MRIGPFTIARTKSLVLQPLSPSQGGWWPIIRESFTGAWQQNVEIRVQDVLAYSAVYACVSLIARDVAKLRMRLVRLEEGIWEETSSPAFSPVLRKPNRYQTWDKFAEQWILSKLTRGNTYVLKQRDQRRVVTALYILDPARVTPLVTPDGAVYYQIKRDDLSGLREESVTVPASEIIHDIMVALWHPLIGVSPVYACGVAALQGLAIQNNSQRFFQNGANPSGVLTAPGQISDETAKRLATYFNAEFSGEKVGRICVVGDGLKYEQLTMTAVDAQLIDQLKWSAETVCSCYHVPPFMIGIGPPPPYANVEPLLQQYHAQCIQSLLMGMESCLDEGLGLLQPIDGVQYGTEADITDLIWMDTATRTKAAADGIGSGGMSPNEARRRYLQLKPTPGGDTPYMQQQYWPLQQLSERPIPETPAGPVPRADTARSNDGKAGEAGEADERAGVTRLDRAALMAALHRKAIQEGLYAA